MLKEHKIASLIFEARGLQVILDQHLALLYKVETRALKQQVRRNIDRFPKDFMFQLNKSEVNSLVSQNVIPNKSILGGAQPMVFTEQGVAMLSSVLRSKEAIAVNIAIMRTFVHMRNMLQEHADLAQKINELEQKYDQQFKTVFSAIKELILYKSEKRKPIGFRQSENKK